MQIHNQEINTHITSINHNFEDFHYPLLEYQNLSNHDYNNPFHFTKSCLQEYDFIFEQQRNFQSANIQAENIISTEEDLIELKKRRFSYVQNDKKKNQTKNIPKNYGKALISYMKKNKNRTITLLKQLNIDPQTFYDYLKQKHQLITTISQLRDFWTEGQYCKPIRILSYQFMRKHSLRYIFGSRIKNQLTHIKYRQKIMEGLKNPLQFNNIKDY